MTEYIKIHKIYAKLNKSNFQSGNKNETDVKQE